MLTVDDIPAEFHGHDASGGARLHRFAAGVFTQLSEASGEKGAAGGTRLLQSVFHLRYSRIGLEMCSNASGLTESLGDTYQFVTLSGYQLAVVSAASAIDLCAAALVILAGGEQREPDLREVARQSLMLSRLPDRHQAWIEATADRADVGDIVEIRNALVHRVVPLHVTGAIGSKSTYKVEVDGVRHDVDPAIAYSVALDCVVGLGLLLTAAGESDA